jgi:hypothetical protein
MNFKLVSKGKKKAEVIVKHENGQSETRHLEFRHGKWMDRLGNEYDLG